MKIAIFWTFPADYILANAKAAVERGHEVILVFLSQEPFLPPVDIPAEIRSFISPSRKNLIKALEDFDPQALVLPGWHVPMYTEIAARHRKTTSRIMVTDTQWRHTAKQVAGRVVFLLFRPLFFDWALVPGERQFHFVRKLGFPSNKITFGSIPANLEIFSQLESLEPRNRSFLFVGRLVKAKGIDTLIAAYKKYREITKDPWDLRIVGEGPFKGLSGDGVHWLGLSSPQVVREEMLQASCFVLPSRFEPWGVVIQEAAACGLPIISSDECGATPHYLQPGLNGIRVKTDSVKQLTRAMIDISSAGSERLQAFSEYSLQISQRQTNKLWVSVVEWISERDQKDSRHRNLD